MGALAPPNSSEGWRGRVALRQPAGGFSPFSLGGNAKCELVDGRKDAYSSLCLRPLPTRRFLQEGLGLEVNASKPLVVCVSRLVPQKGIHLIKRAIFRTVEQGGQFVLLGSGHADGDFRRLAGADFKDHPAVAIKVP